MSGQRVLVISHAHPDFSLGGGELAAYNLFKALKQHPHVQDAWFLARADRGRGATGQITMRRPNEYIWEQAVHNWHMMKAAHQDSLTTWFADLVRALQPTIVFAHHYAHLGLEYLQVLRQVAPQAKIVMTLHEYMAICSNNGQMIKTGNFRLCSRESFDECHQCFPDRSPEDFWMRKHYFLRNFEHIDMFVAPSEFLRQRYVAWGIAPERIIVIENGQATAEPAPPRTLTRREGRNRFGFFGQINPYKGLATLLEALQHATKVGIRSNLVLEVHGANLEQQSAEFQARIRDLAAPLLESGHLQWMGPYQPHELPGRIAEVDWVVIPSGWWENSPMVIQEAFVYGRPVICSDIGGMAEKVRHGVDGYHVPASNVLQWSHVLQHAASLTDEWDRLRASIRRPPSYAGCAQAHLDMLGIR
jgi:glycosyltransferase involved in cell wall biosynthesis